MLNYNFKENLSLDYTEYEINKGKGKEKVLRPMVLASINKKIPSYPALIDSGSDKTISYLEPFGESWGISIDNFEGEPEEISPLSSIPLLARIAYFDVFIGDIYCVNLPVHFLIKKFDEKKDNYPIILGRNIFFKEFDILFRERENKVYLFKNPPL